MAANDQVVVTIKKKGFFQKLKDKWNSLDPETKDWVKITSIFTVDGVIWGTALGLAISGKQIKKEAAKAYLIGVNDGKDDAYLKMMQNPYAMMNAGMTRLEQQGKAKKF